MKIKTIFIILFLIFTYHLALAENNSPNSVRSIIVLDKTRNRYIPLEIYTNKKLQNKINTKLPLVIINHGYTIKNTEYSFIANKLGNQGYLVVSIQHDLSSDSELPKTGSLYHQRKSLWERGVKNILFVIHELKKIGSDTNLKKVILIGHSNGGDISMLFATKYPGLVLKAVSLDSLRIPFPKNKNIKILSLRANDTIADRGVLPSNIEQEKFGIKITPLKNAKHIDMCDRGSIEVKEEINKYILNFLVKS